MIRESILLSRDSICGQGPKLNLAILYVYLSQPLWVANTVRLQLTIYKQAWPGYATCKTGESSPERVECSANAVCFFLFVD